MGSVNDIQVGGTHYKNKTQHWDFVVDNKIDYISGNGSKYITRWRKKNGIQDLEKAGHYVSKRLELLKKGFDISTSVATLARCLEFCSDNELNALETEAIILISIPGSSETNLGRALAIIEELKASA